MLFDIFKVMLGITIIAYICIDWYVDAHTSDEDRRREYEDMDSYYAEVRRIMYM